MKDSSWIRKMFEEGVELKKKYGEENVFDFSLGNPNLDPPEIFFDNLKNLEKNVSLGGCWLWYKDSEKTLDSLS